jgi:iron(III) transport system substrate-binding protein
MRSARVVARAAVAAGTVLVLAACGGSPTAAPANPSGNQDSGPTEAEQLYAEVMALSGQERRDRLVELAAEEDGLNIYTSMNAEVLSEVVSAFEDEFGIEPSVYRAGSETVLQRILQEQNAGFPGNDVVESNATEMMALQQEGVLAPYEGEREKLIPEAGLFEDWTATRFNLFAPSWNTELISGDMVPTSWEELADPKYDGMLAMELGDYDWYMALHTYWAEQGKSEEEINQLFTDMVDGASVVKGHTVMAELMSAGEFGVATSNYTYIVENAAEDGAPVTYQPPVDPVFARPNGIGLMKTAQNPATALLFTDWLLEEGQQIIDDLGLTPAVAEGDQGPELVAVDAKRLLDEGDTWSDRYDELLRGAEVIE